MGRPTMTVGMDPVGSSGHAMVRDVSGRRSPSEAACLPPARGGDRRVRLFFLSMTLAAGTQFGPYEVQDLLGEGGMGAVPGRGTPRER